MVAGQTSVRGVEWVYFSLRHSSPLFFTALFWWSLPSHPGAHSLSSSFSVEHLAEVLPLHFLRKLVVKLQLSSDTFLTDVHQRVAPFVLVPQRLQVARCKENE